MTMPLNSRDDVLAHLLDVGIIPVVRVPTLDQAVQAASLVEAGGVPVVEITMTVPSAPEAIAAVARAGRVLVGAGTVLSGAQAEACLDAGARFIVTPVLVPDVIDVCRARDVPVIMGALTPSEILTAWRLGADLVKVFPAHAVGGPAYLRAVLGPLPQIRLVPTGGVTLDSVPAFFAAGAVAIGVGGDVVNPRLLATGQADEITARAQAFSAAVRAARQRA